MPTRTAHTGSSSRPMAIAGIEWADWITCSGGARSTRSSTCHLEDAHGLAEAALAHAREHEERGRQAWALRLLGEITARRTPQEREEAEANYHQALALANELGMRPLQAHGHRGLGTLYAMTARREQAHTELSTAIDLYRSMEMTFWLPEAEAALAQVEGR